MADETDVIIPLSVDTGNVDESLASLEARVDSLRSKLLDLTADSADYLEVQKQLITATTQASDASAKFDNILTSVDSTSQKVATDTQVMTDNFTQAAAGTEELSEGTRGYTQTLEALRSEGGLTNITLNDLKNSQKELEREMAATQTGSEKWLELRNSLQEVKQAQTDYRNLARETEGEMQAQTNTIASMRAEVSALKKEWVNADIGSDRFKELTVELKNANDELKAQEFAVGITSRGVGDYAGQISTLIPQLSGMTKGLQAAQKGTVLLQGGFKQLTAAVKAFLKDPLMLTLTALIGAFTALSKILDNQSTKAAEKFTSAVDKETAALKANSDEANHNINIMRARGATAVEVANAELTAATNAALAARDAYAEFLNQYENLGRQARKKAKDTLDNLKKLADDASANVTAVANRTEVTLTSEQTKGENERETALKAARDKRIAEEQAAAAKAVEIIRNTQSELKFIQASETDAILAEYNRRRKEVESQYKEDRDALIRAGESTTDLELLYQKRLTQIDADEMAERSRQRYEALSKELAQADDNYAEIQNAELLRAAETEALRAQAQADLLAAEANNDAQLREAALARLEEYRIIDEEAQQIARDNEALALQTRLETLQQALSDEQLIGEERIAIEQRVADTQLQISLNAAANAKAIADKQIADYKANADAQKKIDDQTLKNKKATTDAISALLQAGSKAVGENTALGKTLGVANAVVSTYSGASQTLADPTLPFVAKLAGMAAILTAGFVNVREILKVQVPGTSSSSGSLSVPTVNVPDVKTMAQYQTPIQEVHSNITADEIDTLNQDQRVYVLESDITNSQKKVRVSSTESDF